MKLPKIIAAFALCLCLVSCARSAGYTYSGSDRLDPATFTGEYSAEVSSLGGRATLLESDLKEAKTILVTGEAVMRGSGIMGYFRLYLANEDGASTLFDTGGSGSFGIDMEWSSTYNDMIELPAGKNRLILSGNTSDLTLDLEITDAP